MPTPRCTPAVPLQSQTVLGDNSPRKNKKNDQADVRLLALEASLGLLIPYYSSACAFFTAAVFFKQLPRPTQHRHDSTSCARLLALYTYRRTLVSHSYIVI